MTLPLLPLLIRRKGHGPVLLPRKKGDQESLDIVPLESQKQVKRRQRQCEFACYNPRKSETRSTGIVLGL